MDDEGRVAHAERGKQVGRQIGLQRHAADRLDHLPDPVDADAVFPAFTRIDGQRLAERAQLAIDEQRNGVLAHVAFDGGVPDVVAEAGRMGEQVAKRDRPLGRAQDRPAGTVETVEHLRRGETRHDPGDRLVQRDAALLDQLHGAGRNQRLGHGGVPEDRVQRHRHAAAEAALAEGAFVEPLVVVDGNRHDAWNLASPPPHCSSRRSVAWTSIAVMLSLPSRLTLAWCRSPGPSALRQYLPSARRPPSGTAARCCSSRRAGSSPPSGPV